MLTVDGDQSATDLFEFVAQNSNVEWSLVRSGKQMNSLTTSNKPHSEGGGADIIYNFAVSGNVNVREHIHSHPTSLTGPSGFHPSHQKTGDKDFAQWMGKYLPNATLQVYEKRTQKYIKYNSTGIIK